MTFQSKFDIGDMVYYWSINKVKILFGRIEAISLYQTEDEESNWSYSMKQIDPNNEQPMFSLREQVPEHLIFRQRGDVLDFCMKLSEGI